MGTSEQVISYVDSFNVAEFLKFDSIIDILPTIKSVDFRTQDGRDLRTWKDFFTKNGVPWLLLKVEEDKIDKEGETFKKVNFKLWKKCEVEEGNEARVCISSLFPELLSHKSCSEFELITT